MCLVLIRKQLIITYIHLVPIDWSVGRSVGGQSQTAIKSSPLVIVSTNLESKIILMRSFCF